MSINLSVQRLPHISLYREKAKKKRILIRTTLHAMLFFFVCVYSKSRPPCQKVYVFKIDFLAASILVALEYSTLQYKKINAILYKTNAFALKRMSSYAFGQNILNSFDENVEEKEFKNVHSNDEFNFFILLRRFARDCFCYAKMLLSIGHQP